MKVHWQVNAGRLRQTLRQRGKVLRSMQRRLVAGLLIGLIVIRLGALPLTPGSGGGALLLRTELGVSDLGKYGFAGTLLLRSGSSRNLTLEFYEPPGHINQDCASDLG